MLALNPLKHAERVASLQRRKNTLETICADALRLGEAIKLRGAATVEFLVDEQGEAYFLEVNPRIQVEHGVTEGIARVHGKPISLVEWQQRVAAGEQLDFQAADISFVGDAIEVRLNAWHEDLSPVLGGVVHALRLDPPLPGFHGSLKAIQGAASAASAARCSRRTLSSTRARCGLSVSESLPA